VEVLQHQSVFACACIDNAPRLSLENREGDKRVPLAIMISTESDNAVGSLSRKVRGCCFSRERASRIAHQSRINHASSTRSAGNR
jgi:hypothetical protein